MFAGLAAAAAGLLLTTGAAVHAANYKVGFITSLSGPEAGLGVAYQKGMKAAYAYQSEVNGRKITLIQMDDETNPTVADRDAHKLVNQEHVDVIIGTANVPDSTAIASVAYRLKTPMIALAPIALQGERASWTVTVPQPVPLMVDAVMKRAKADGVKTVAVIGFADAAGDLFSGAVHAAAKREGIAVVADERFATSDTSVTGQILRILQKHPDAIVDTGAGGPGALPVLELAKLGRKIPVYGTHAMMSEDFVRIAGKAGDGVVAPAGPFMVAAQLPSSNPMRQISLDFGHVYERVNHEVADQAFPSYSFDAWLIFLDAVKRVPPNVQPGTEAFRAALHEALYNTRELIGTQAIYNFRPGDTYGVDARAAVMVRLQGGKWVLADAP